MSKERPYFKAQVRSERRKDSLEKRLADPERLPAQIWDKAKKEWVKLP